MSLVSLSLSMAFIKGNQISLMFTFFYLVINYILCIADIPYRPNLFLQILLFLNIYLSALALISVGFYIIFNVNTNSNYN